MRTPPERFPSTLRDDPLIGAGLLAGAANVIMQLARPEIGYGVVESRVTSGNIYQHPIKRARTTFTYLAVAMLGTGEEKQAYRRAVNAVHAQVRSTEASPVQYDAGDPELQLWVAACLYKGIEDTYQVFFGPLHPGLLEDIYQTGASLGTTLQVRADMWPVNRTAFAEYWDRSLENVSIDDTVRNYLHGIATLRFLPRAVHRLFGPANRFVTTGFLPPRFRTEMRLAWSPRHQRRFEVVMRTLGAVIQRLPRPFRVFPYNVLLQDLRRRIRTSRPLV